MPPDSNLGPFLTNEEVDRNEGSPMSHLSLEGKLLVLKDGMEPLGYDRFDRLDVIKDELIHEGAEQLRDLGQHVNLGREGLNLLGSDVEVPHGLITHCLEPSRRLSESPDALG